MRIELLPESVLGQRRRQQLVRRWAIALVGTSLMSLSVVLAVGVMLGGPLTAALLPGPRSAAAMAITQTQVPETAAALTAQIDELSVAENASREELREVMARVAANRALADAVDWSDLLETVAVAATDGVVLGRVALGSRSGRDGGMGTPGTNTARDGARTTGPGLTIEIDGVGRTPREVSAFVLQLESLDLFDHVSLLETRGRSLGGGIVSTFRIRCVVRDRERSSA